MVSEVKNEEHQEAERAVNYQVNVPKLEFHFCNQQADQMFNTRLSQIPKEDLHAASQLLLQSRCLQKMDDETIAGNAAQLLNQESSLPTHANEDQQLINLLEAADSFPLNQESAPF